MTLIENVLNSSSVLAPNRYFRTMNREVHLIISDKIFSLLGHCLLNLCFSSGKHGMVRLPIIHISAQLKVLKSIFSQIMAKMIDNGENVGRKLGLYADENI